MKQAEQAEAFEEALISYAEMCYSVALALTRNPDRAQDLARHVLTWAWTLRDSANGKKDIKTKLRIAVRKRFLKDYCQVPCSQKRSNTCGEDIVCTAQDAERSIERVSGSVRTAMWSS